MNPREITLQQAMDKVAEAIGGGGFHLRMSGGGGDPNYRWHAYTCIGGQEDIQGHGAIPQEALICFLALLNEHYQRHSADQEGNARDARDVAARVRRALETL